MDARSPSSQWRKGAASRSRRDDGPIVKMIREQTRDGAELVELLLSVARGQLTTMDDAKSRRWAIDRLWDRGYGKVAQVIELPHTDDAPPLDDAPWSDEELAVLAKADGYPLAPVLQLVPADPANEGG